MRGVNNVWPFKNISSNIEINYNKAVLWHGRRQKRAWLNRNLNVRSERHIGETARIKWSEWRYAVFIHVKKVKKRGEEEMCLSCEISCLLEMLYGKLLYDINYHQ